MKRNIKIILFIVCITGIQLSSHAQQVVKGYEMLEVVRLSEAYRAAPNLSFDIDYTYADSANPTTILEQLSGNSKASLGKYWTMLDSVEMIQGLQYNISVYHNDSTIIVSDKVKYGNMMRVQFLDSAFRKANVDSLRIDSVNTSTRELVVLFKSISIYSKYVCRYNLNTYLVDKITYYTRDVSDTTAVPSGIAVITLTISNYSQAAVDPSIFNESRYVYKQNGQLFKHPSYTDFTLINNSSN